MVFAHGQRRLNTCCYAVLFEEFAIMSRTRTGVAVIVFLCASGLGILAAVGGAGPRRSGLLRLGPPRWSGRWSGRWSCARPGGSTKACGFARFFRTRLRRVFGRIAKGQRVEKSSPSDLT